MPVTEILNRNTAFAIKYEWPEQALIMMSKSKQIPVETYTEEQARRFVTNGLLYLERGMFAGEVFNKLGSESDHITRSFVYGIDDVPGGNPKPRWRWLPLIDGYDAARQPIYHTSTWDGGVKMKSMDLLRLDYYFSRSSQYFVPTAIVQPRQKENGFGRGLQFNTVYEYPTSFARFKRNPTFTSAILLHDAIRTNSQHWLDLVTANHRELITSQYHSLSAKKIFVQLRGVVVKTKAPKRAGNFKQADVPENIRETELPLDIQQNTQASRDQSSSSRWTRAPVSVEAPFRNWNGRAFAYPNSKEDFNTHGQSLTITTNSYEYGRTQQHSSFDFAGEHQYRGASSSTRSPNAASLQVDSNSHQLFNEQVLQSVSGSATPHTVLQVGHGQPSFNTQSRTAKRLPPFEVGSDDQWLQLGPSRFEETPETGDSPAIGSSDRSQSGFARWRRPT